MPFPLITSATGPLKSVSVLSSFKSNFVFDTIVSRDEFFLSSTTTLAVLLLFSDNTTSTAQTVLPLSLFSNKDLTDMFTRLVNYCWRNENAQLVFTSYVCLAAEQPLDN